jgi:hypothetical protein
MAVGWVDIQVSNQKGLATRGLLAVDEEDLLLRNSVLKTELSNPGCRKGGRAADNIEAEHVHLGGT